MATILDRIIETKRKEVEATRQHRPPADLYVAIEHADPPRDFLAAVTAKSARRINLIAEIKKKKSPLAGVIGEDFDPVRIAQIYHYHGAAALSVLTNETCFGGKLEFIAAVKQDWAKRGFSAQRGSTSLN